MNLAIDIGNTRIKCGLFDGDFMVDYRVFQSEDWQRLLDWANNTSCENCVISSVRGYSFPKLQLLKPRGHKILLDHTLNYPVQIRYETPNTLGMDRLAAVVGAFYTFRDENILVVDAGTCITFDLLTGAGEYMGGAISPGREMRLKAMHVFTSKLPAVNPDELFRMVGTNTEDAIRNGTQVGVVAEVDYWIDRIQAALGGVKTLVTGGDAAYVKKYTRNSVFEHPHLVLFGAIKILQYNVDK